MILLSIKRKRSPKLYGLPNSNIDDSRIRVVPTSSRVKQNKMMFSSIQVPKFVQRETPPSSVNVAKFCLLLILDYGTALGNALVCYTAHSIRRNSKTVLCATIFSTPATLSQYIACVHYAQLDLMYYCGRCRRNSVAACCEVSEVCLCAAIERTTDSSDGVFIHVRLLTDISHLRSSLQQRHAGAICRMLLALNHGICSR